jgi:UDP-glucose 4-epimerase
MRVLVTGPLGHIGSALIRAFPLDLVERVDLVDNLSTQRFPSLFDLPADRQYRFFEEDICTTDLERRFKGADVVIHLAAITNAEQSVHRRAEVEKVNLDGTARVADACLKTGSRLVFVSTTSVYGVQDSVVTEDCPIESLQPQSPYADCKLRAENLLLEAAQRGLDTVICRFGTVVGPSPGMQFNTAINKFVWLASTGRPLTVWRTAMNQRRPYLHLSDAVRAINFILEGETFDSRIYNVLTCNATVGEIVDMVRAVFPEVAVQLVESPIMNQLSYTVSNDRFRELGFDFTGDLAEAIQDTARVLGGIAGTGRIGRKGVGLDGNGIRRRMALHQVART